MKAQCHSPKKQLIVFTAIPSLCCKSVQYKNLFTRLHVGRQFVERWMEARGGVGCCSGLPVSSWHTGPDQRTGCSHGRWGKLWRQRLLI